MPLFATMLGGAAPQIVVEHGTTVTLAVSDLRNANGVVRACMTRDPKRFPGCRGDAQAYSAIVDARGGAVTMRFVDVAPGRYAVALLHDENANGKPDLALGMVPKEGFGFSRDAKVQMGPPKFDDAVVAIDRAPRTLPIRMRYIF
ncbi:MAG: DUF2141 domain-containing protein [Erythrobacter sp.]|nr:DUF2141 domain-containing protein [Erythrobacter sp.]